MTLDPPMMFIRNCPDPELTLIFKCKPLDEWTTADVQIRLDEYQIENKFLQHKYNLSDTACHAQSTDILSAHGRGVGKNTVFLNEFWIRFLSAGNKSAQTSTKSEEWCNQTKCSM